MVEKQNGWIVYEGNTVPPLFGNDDVVEVEYRDGRRASGNEPWMLQGWNHTGFRTDIVKYRLLDH